jgi:hypothetical protein
MKPKDIDYVRSKVENEGFDYCFTGYSDFEDIKDEEFHTLRKAYVKAQEDLSAFLGLDD